MLAAFMILVVFVSMGIAILAASEIAWAVFKFICLAVFICVGIVFLPYFIPALIIAIIIVSAISRGNGESRSS